ncbi:MAG: hypothetical protein KF787_04825 [Phycisphaeraceae bacterium]|nr:hypothetical protein [Phycisphaerae bacterium]MBX3391953.1 hypothetical protein [Phycisphaeraceae bacterium]HRJ50811.1 hypothetical protein [Phycisphaerales bacterium]
MNDIKRVAEQIRRAGERIRPRASAAIDAIDHGVVEPAADAAAHGAKRLRHAVSAFLAAASHLLGDLSDSVEPSEGPPSAGSKPAKKGRSGSGAGKSRAARGAGSSSVKIPRRKAPTANQGSHDGLGDRVKPPKAAARRSPVKKNPAKPSRRR